MSVCLLMFPVFLARQDYIFFLFGSLMNEQTWKEEESVSKQELRSALLETACSLNDENCTQQAKALFRRYVESNGTLRWDQHTANTLWPAYDPSSLCVRLRLWEVNWHFLHLGPLTCWRLLIFLQDPRWSAASCLQRGRSVRRRLVNVARHAHTCLLWRREA